MQKGIQRHTVSDYIIRDVFPNKQFGSSEQRRVASQISSLLTKSATSEGARAEE